MTSVFADTFYFLALLDTREERHLAAAEASRNPELRLVITEWVLAEFGHAYCHEKDRADFVSLYRSLANHPRVKVIPADTRLFQRGVDLFGQRQDKDWSLTATIDRWLALPRGSRYSPSQWYSHVERFVGLVQRLAF